MFKDKKARKAIDVILTEIGFVKGYWLKFQPDITSTSPTLKDQLDEMYENIENLIEKQDLILKHLNLEYVPASEIMEPARLEPVVVATIDTTPKPKKKRKAKKAVSWYDSTPFDTPVKKRGRPRKST